MPRIATIDLAEATNRLKGRTPGHEARAPYREAIANLTGDRVIELEPDEGETIRKLKLLTSRAAKEVNRQVGYGETEEGTLLIWLEDQKAPRQRRARRRTADPADLAAQVL